MICYQNPSTKKHIDAVACSTRLKLVYFGYNSNENTFQYLQFYCTVIEYLYVTEDFGLLSEEWQVQALGSVERDWTGKTVVPMFVQLELNFNFPNN